jgi:hypothetical protein
VIFTRLFSTELKQKEKKKRGKQKEPLSRVQGEADLLHAKDTEKKLRAAARDDEKVALKEYPFLTEKSKSAKQVYVLDATLAGKHDD